MGTILRHKDSCQHRAAGSVLVEVGYCPTCRVSDTTSAGAFRAALDWLSHRVETSIVGIHFEEDISVTGAARTWSLSYEIPIMETKIAGDDGFRLLTITQAAPGAHFDITSDTPLDRITPTYVGQACWHCIAEGCLTVWNRDAAPVTCARHAALEVPCPTCGGTGADANCAACAGAGVTLSDKILWAAELLALPYMPAAERQGEYWLAAMVLNAIEVDPQHWTVTNLLEAFGGIQMLGQPGYPWAGERFAVTAQETIVDIVAMLLRKEIVTTTQESALIPLQG